MNERNRTGEALKLFSATIQGDPKDDSNNTADNVAAAQALSLILSPLQPEESLALKNTKVLIRSLLHQMEQAEQRLSALVPIKNKFARFALVGMGGSSLGVQALSQFFGKSNFIFFDNVDSVDFEIQLNQLGSLQDICWLFVSKTGETIETLLTLELVDQIYQKKGLSLDQQCLVITENNGGSLSLWAQTRGVSQFEVPLEVGGRFSVLSYVGLVPAYLMGLNISGLARGAHLAITEDHDLLVNLVSCLLSSFRREEWITVLWGYSSRLKTFGLWWQQLWAESLAKKVNLQGQPAPRVSTPMVLIGATDQHSVLQQISEGYKDKFVIFLRIKEAESGAHQLEHSQFKATQILKGRRMGDLLRAEAIATQLSLTEAGVSNLTLKIESFDEVSLGRLLMLMQVAVLALGQSLNLNPLNQPGVERGKELCKKILSDEHHGETRN